MRIQIAGAAYIASHFCKGLAQAPLGALQQGRWEQFDSVVCPEFPTISKALRKRGFAYGVTTHGGYATAVFNKNPGKKRICFAICEAGYLRNAVWIPAMAQVKSSVFGESLRRSELC